MAAGLLLIVVIAVTTAISAGQQHAYEAHQRIAASLVAEELMGRIAAEPYDRIITWDGFVEQVGEITDMHGESMPSSLQMVGRDANVTIGLETITGLDVRVRGSTVVVRAFNAEGRVLASITRFVPEPQS